MLAAWARRLLHCGDRGRLALHQRSLSAPAKPPSPTDTPTGLQDASGFGNLHPKLLKALEDAGISAPTEVQKQVIPLLWGQAMRDIVMVAETGSGKTLAYLLPLLHRLAKAPHPMPMALVLTPTPELASQVRKVASHYGSEITGVTLAVRSAPLTLGPDTGIVVGTPAVIGQYAGSALANVRTVVLDEADMLLSPSFAKPIEALLDQFRSQGAQFVLAAATMSEAGKKSLHAKVASLFLHAHYVSLATKHRTVPSLTPEFVHVANDTQRDEELLGLLRGHGMRGQPVLVFTRSIKRADQVAAMLQSHGIRCASMHSEVDIHVRMQATDWLLSGKLDCLVSTDLNARGLDLRNVALVIEYDLATNVVDYLHRAGRTARAGQPGRIVSFVGPGDAALAGLLTEMEPGMALDELFSRRRLLRRKIRKKEKRTGKHVR